MLIPNGLDAQAALMAIYPLNFGHQQRKVGDNGSFRAVSFLGMRYERKYISSHQPRSTLLNLVGQTFANRIPSLSCTVADRCASICLKVLTESVLFNHSWNHLKDSPATHFNTTLLTRLVCVQKQGAGVE